MTIKIIQKRVRELRDNKLQSSLSLYELEALEDIQANPSFNNEFLGALNRACNDKGGIYHG